MYVQTELCVAVVFIVGARIECFLIQFEQFLDIRSSGARRVVILQVLEVRYFEIERIGTRGGSLGIEEAVLPCWGFFAKTGWRTTLRHRFCMRTVRHVTESAFRLTYQICAKVSLTIGEPGSFRYVIIVLFRYVGKTFRARRVANYRNAIRGAFAFQCDTSPRWSCVVAFPD